VVLSGPVPDKVQVEDVIANPGKFNLEVWVMGNKELMPITVCYF